MKIAMSGEHALSLEALRSRIDARVAYYDQRYPKIGVGQFYRWLDDANAVAEYRGGRARMAIGPRTLDVQIELPFFAGLYRARIEDFVRRELGLVTAPEAPTDATTGSGS